jgi:dihydroorotate dehydrogenase (fumarate)
MRPIALEGVMADIKTDYLGLSLANPIIITSSRLTATLDGVKRCEDAGAGAVVLKSIFEEQIDFDSAKMLEGADASYHADAYDFFANTSKDYYIDRYLELVEQAKASLSIPVIASVNCIHSGSWIDYAHRFQEVNADALEMNVYIIPSDASKTPEHIEQEYDRLVKEVRSKITIPLALKIGQQFTALANRLRRFEMLGVDALVLFNRFYRTDIDINKELMVPGKVLSVPEESAIPLQWTALSSGELDLDICANSGIFTGEDMIKQLLAGAACVGICSAVMKHGHGVIDTMNKDLEQWMDRKGYQSIADFKGKLCQENLEHPDLWERSQYVKAVCGIE